MSYSYVKLYGFPSDLGEYETAYHIVRESDLLSSYDFNRCLSYGMHKTNNFKIAYDEALELFKKRMFKYHSEQLFLSNYSIKMSLKLSYKSCKQIRYWKQIYKNHH